MDNKIKDWWPPSEIYFSKAQVRWLLSNWDELSDGQWIPQCADTGYTGTDKLKSNRAPFENSMIVVAELSARLDACSSDAIIAIQYFNEYIDSHLNTIRTAHNVVRYCTGWVRQSIPYREWLIQQEAKRQKYRILVKV